MAFSIPDATIEEIKARTDLADLISSYGIQVKRAGGSYKACCPFHNEKTPSFNIQPAKGFYHCFGCGESGDCFKFVMKQEGLTFVEAVKKLGAACGVNVEEKHDPAAGRRKRLLALNAEAAAFFRRCLISTKAAARARAYLASRDLDDAICERFLLGYVPEGDKPILQWAAKHGFATDELDAAGLLRPPRYAGDNWYNPFGGRLAFAIRDRAGRVVGFSCRTLETDKAKMRGGKYVNTRETDVFRKSDVLYAFDLAAAAIVKDPHREAIVCEGQIDVIRCHACGFATAVASEGTAFTVRHVEMLKKCADAAVLLFDGDEAGAKASVRTGAEFLAAGLPVRVAALPPGEDPDSYLRAQGADALRARLAEARSVTDFQVRWLLGKEADPEQPNAKMRVARAAFATLAACPSAVLRASLLAETAALLDLPVAALEADFAEFGAKDKAPNAQGSTSARACVPREQSGETPLPPSPAPLPQAQTPDDQRPSSRELTLCEYLFERGADPALAELLTAHAPDELFAHPFTRMFVAAWRTGGNDALFALHAALDEADRRLLDGIFATRNMSALSERPPEEVVQQFLRQLWVVAVRRVHDARAETETAGAEQDARTLACSTLCRRLRCAPWLQAAALMTPASFSKSLEV